MAIPIPMLSAIQSAGTFPTPAVGQPLYCCNTPSEGFRSISAQFKFTQFLSWKVNITNGAPNPPLSQIAALFLDGSQLANDIYIYFPDSNAGYMIAPGGSQLIPVLSNQKLPVFYVILVGSGGALTLNNTDVLNMLILNQYILPFNTNGNVRAQSFGFGDHFATIPEFLQDDFFAVEDVKTAASGTQNFMLVNQQEWYLKTFCIELIGSTADSSTTQFTATLFDGTTQIGIKTFLMDGELKHITLFDEDDLNYQSLGGGTMNITLTDSGNILNATLTSNVGGGIL